MSAKKKDKVIEEKNITSIVEEMKEYLDTEGSSPTKKRFLSSGNLALDFIISGKVDGSGGYPCGIVELFGDPSTGKSLLLAKAGAITQQQGGLFIVADAEERWDDHFASIHGVDSGLVIKFTPETVEEFTVKAYDILNKYGDSVPITMALDSLAALSTVKEISDVESGDGIKADQGRKAQKIKASMRVLKSLINKTGTIMLVTNHIIAVPGAYGVSYTTPGGKGASFHSNVRVELLKSTPIKLEGRDRPIGVTLRVKIAKNSIAPPFGEAEMQLFWGRGIDPYSGLLDIATDLGIVEKAGGWFKFGGDSFHANDFNKIIEEHPEILQSEVWNRPYFTEY